MGSPAAAATAASGTPAGREEGWAKVEGGSPVQKGRPEGGEFGGAGRAGYCLTEGPRERTRGRQWCQLLVCFLLTPIMKWLRLYCGYHLWLIHVDVWQKTKFCKEIILQLKNKLKKSILCSHRAGSLAEYTCTFWPGNGPPFCNSGFILSTKMTLQGSQK